MVATTCSIFVVQPVDNAVQIEKYKCLDSLSLSIFLCMMEEKHIQSGSSGSRVSDSSDLGEVDVLTSMKGQ